MGGTQTETGQTVVVLGGGIGGVVAANRLRRKLDTRHEIVLVNREPVFSFAASYLWVMTGQRAPRQVTRPLRRLERRGIQVLIGEVTAVDPAARKVVVGSRQLTADHLVIALGAEQVPDRVPGLTEVGHTFATLPGARRLGVELDEIERGRILVVTAAPIYRCPAAPYEAALLIDAHLRQRGVRDRVEVAVHAAEPMPMGVAGKNVADAVQGMLAQRQIAYHPGHQISSAEAGSVRFADDRDEEFDLLCYMPPIAPPPVLAGSPLAGPTGWVEADPKTLTTSHDNVWAIGDNVQIPLAIGKPLPRAGVFAHGQAKVVADRIVSTITGKPVTAEFDGHGGCFIEIGEGKAAYGSGDFYADPSPSVRIRRPAAWWHLGKVAFEQDVLRRWL